MEPLRNLAVATPEAESTPTAAEIAKVAAFLRRFEVLGSSCQSANAAGSLTTEETDDGALPKGADMCRVNVFKDRNKWRVRVIDLDTGKATTSTYETEEEARTAAPKLKRQYERPVGKPMGKALEDYRAKLVAKGNKERSIETTLGRLAEVFKDPNVVTGSLTPSQVTKAWDRYATAEGPHTKRVPSVSTRANTLNEARTFCRWLLEKEWVKVELLAGIKVEGKRKRRKAQLDRVSDVKKFVALALHLGTSGDRGAVAAASALLLGLRASEIANTTVRDLDDDFRIWIVVDAKTEAGDRKLRIPETLRPLLVGLAAGKGPSDRVFGEGADRYWVRHAVRRICRDSGVPVISAHGLRGTHTSLAIGAGVSGLAVAASLGHESFAMTERHYASPDSVAGARVDRVLEAIA